MIKTVVLDLDGTLLNTLDDINDSLNIALNENGFEGCSLEDTKRYLGHGVSMLVHRAISRFEHNDLQEANVLQSYTREYDERKTNKTNVYFGINELLQYLKENNIKTAVLSNKNHDDTVEVVNKYFGEDYFDIVRGKQKGIPVKPDPTSLFEILEELRVHHEEVLYVGDSEADMEVANNANIKKVGCAYGYRDIDTLNIYNPDYVVNSPLEIIDILKDLNQFVEEEFVIEEEDDGDLSQASNEQM